MALFHGLVDGSSVLLHDLHIGDLHGFRGRPRLRRCVRVFECPCGGFVLEGVYLWNRTQDIKDVFLS